MKVIPPNFGYVEEGIFRCGAPEPRHYGFLSSLGLRTCILLTDIHDDAFVHWLQEAGVTIFCPLVSESQTGGNVVRGAAPAYHAAAIAESGASGGVMDRRSRGGAPSGGANGSSKEDATAGGLTSSNLDATRAFAGANSVDNMSIVDADGAPDGFTDERAGGGGVGGGVDLGAGVSRGWPSGAVSGAAAGGAGGAPPGSSVGVSGAPVGAGTSNAARFLQENVAERQATSKFTPVFIPEPLYFPANGGAGIGMGSGSRYDAAVPSYEGKLHGLMTLSEAVVVSILHLLLDPQYYPLLVTCSKGRYRSGIVCGCLRKLQGWNLVSILEEYRRFAGNKSRADNEEFIELFDEELVSLELSDGRRPTILYNA